MVIAYIRSKGSYLFVYKISDLPPSQFSYKQKPYEMTWHFLIDDLIILIFYVSNMVARAMKHIYASSHYLSYLIDRQPRYDT